MIYDSVWWATDHEKGNGRLSLVQETCRKRVVEANRLPSLSLFMLDERVQQRQLKPLKPEPVNIPLCRRLKPNLIWQRRKKEVMVMIHRDILLLSKQKRWWKRFQLPLRLQQRRPVIRGSSWELSMVGPQ